MKFQQEATLSFGMGTEILTQYNPGWGQTLFQKPAWFIQPVWCNSSENPTEMQKIKLATKVIWRSWQFWYSITTRWVPQKNTNITQISSAQSGVSSGKKVQHPNFWATQHRLTHNASLVRSTPTPNGISIYPGVFNSCNQYPTNTSTSSLWVQCARNNEINQKLKELNLAKLKPDLIEFYYFRAENISAYLTAITGHAYRSVFLKRSSMKRCPQCHLILCI